MRVRPFHCAHVPALAGLASLLVVTPFLLSAPAALAATDSELCASLNDAVHGRSRPSDQASLTTPWLKEATGAAKYGFTEDRGVLFQASTTAAQGLVAVHRLYRSTPSNDFFDTSDAGDISAAVADGYQDLGPRYYASAGGNDCLAAVHQFTKGGKHRLASSAGDRLALTQQGWTGAGVAFYATPATTPEVTPPTPPVSAAGASFRFAVIPDTQQEVLSAKDGRMVNRSKWLVDQKVAFAAQTGDLVNWDTPDHAQYEVAKKGMDVLEDAGIPYTAAIGNHDSQATGVGGSARDPQNTRALQRDTTTFNSYFTPADFTRVGGAYEKGKVDNIYATYEAGGLKWLVLVLEFCPRPGAVTWAKKVVADHPDHNVLVTTHSYLNGSGGISSSNEGYGDTSGQQLFEQLVSQYPNVRMVFSGHVGHAAKARVDTGVKGNKVYSFLTSMHDNTTNPVRMMEVDAKAGTLKTWVYAPHDGYTWTQYSETLSGVDFVR